MVRVLFFGRLGDAAGATETTVELTRGEMEVEAFRSLVTRSNPGLADALASSSVRAIVNRQIVLPGAVVRDGDEVAFLPPVSGG